MGLLDQLWDDTVAGLRPETGLGRLRKQSFSGLCSNSGKEGAAKDAETGRSEGAGEEVAVRVTRSIMIITCECHAAGVARRIHAAKLALFR